MVLGIFRGYLVLQQRHRLSGDFPHDGHNVLTQTPIFLLLDRVNIRTVNDQLNSLMNRIGHDGPGDLIQLLRKSRSFCFSSSVMGSGLA